MRRLALACALLAACGDNLAPHKEPPPPTHQGGTVLVEGCGYALTTRLGASAPVPGQPGIGATPSPYHIHLGLAGDPRTSMVITWQSRDATTMASTVQLGKASVAEQTREGYTWDYIIGFGNDGPRVRLHEAHLCGLEPDTEYVYRVGGTGADGVAVFSPEYRFRTAPDLAADPAAEVVLLALGDTRDGYDTFGQMLAKARELASPDLILFTGDATTIGPLQDEWEAYFDAAEPVLRETPIVAAHGNHEVNAVNYYSLFAMPGDEENYALDYGAAHIVVVNDSPEDSGALEGAIPAFLEQDLAAATAAGAPWKLVMHHRPPFSSAANHGSDSLLQSTWSPIYDTHHVDVVLNGHEHNYERTHPLEGGEVKATPAEGTIYVVSGGAGADLYGNGSNYFTATSASTQNMVVLSVRAGSLDAKAYKDDGTVLDQFSISKP
jgi:hypothetical protein